ncbi:HNH endonuclease [Pseudorhodobacter sp.]|uniref:HNH endonuclease n=1 Tax=Pseudorhodobacter sp. TaxID=1934400 RepID=UPI0026474DB5|nr:HNH endonuclease signature motif containing protein [Pseudorhodobacter sp.]MDN5787862.1 HNH endonuclease [Pseudorhodobacter sp.]
MMKIGGLIQHYIPIIFALCEKQDHAEFDRLCDRAYSKDVLDVNFPFCKPISEISALENRRYWSQVYIVRGMSVRVTSQWFDPPTSKSRPFLLRYLERQGIGVIDAARTDPVSAAIDNSVIEQTKKLSRGRYKGNAIGNAQNLVVRNILSNLGTEDFGEKHWRQVIEDFGGLCVYCGQDSELVMDHVVPINRQSLGEHRLGNLVPSCKGCNAIKGDKDFRAFLSAQPDRIAVIETHMDRHDYVPVSENEQIRQIIELAHKEIVQVASRYIDILNTLTVGQNVKRGET